MLFSLRYIRYFHRCLLFFSFFFVRLASSSSRVSLSFPVPPAFPSWLLMIRIGLSLVVRTTRESSTDIVSHLWVSQVLCGISNANSDEMSESQQCQVAKEEASGCISKRGIRHIESSIHSHSVLSSICRRASPELGLLWCCRQSRCCIRSKVRKHKKKEWLHGEYICLWRQMSSLRSNVAIAVANASTCPKKNRSHAPYCKARRIADISTIVTS